MAETTQQSPWNRTRDIHREYARFYELFGGGSVFLVLGLIGLLIFAESVTDYQMNTYTELLGVALTVLVLDRRAKHRADRERKEELIFLMGSEDNSTALNSVRLLRHKGWLEDGSLNSAYLTVANLKGADLVRADLEGVRLGGVNLEGSDLRHANLENANLVYANLRDADLLYANLRNANLLSANLVGANLIDVNLEGANLRGANLDNAVWLYERLPESAMAFAATLPDGTRWTPETDVTRFTDENHPNFWMPDRFGADKTEGIAPASKS